jgi:hypothetical protein
VSRPCNELAEKRCYQCGRRGVKAFHRHRTRVGFHEIEVWRCANQGRCGSRGFDIGVALEEFDVAYRRVNPAIPTPPAEATSVSAPSNEASP